MTHRVQVYPHNDLMNLAFHQLQLIRSKLKGGNEDGIKLDYLSCLISLAFSVEALVNFVGYKRVAKWKERDNYSKKMELVCALSGNPFDKKVGLYEQLWKLKKLRDCVAHGKPVKIETTVTTRDELRELMQCPWDASLTLETVEAMYEAVNEFEKLLIEGCKIQIGETVTSVVRIG